jgi:hypothetical protein
MKVRLDFSILCRELIESSLDDECGDRDLLIARLDRPSRP